MKEVMAKCKLSDYSGSHKGKVAIVTGANSGLGYYTALGLAQKGCEVVMACRSMERGEIARKELLEKTPEAKVVLMQLDLADLNGVREFAMAYKKQYDRLDLLMNNAGIMAIPYGKTKDGFEMQFGVNHLGHFVLTAELLSLLKASGPSRIVSVSSLAHKMGAINYEDINWEKNYSKMRAYGMSKLANLLFARELADRISASGSEIKVMAAHPGYADSNLFERGPQMENKNFTVKLTRMANRLVAQTTQMGALPSLYAAISEDAENGAYYGPSGMFEVKGCPKKVNPSKRKVSKQDQERLWDLSESLTGIQFSV